MRLFGHLNRTGPDALFAEFPPRMVARPVRDESYNQFVELIELEREIGVHPEYRNRRSRFTAADIALWESEHKRRMIEMKQRWAARAEP